MHAFITMSWPTGCSTSCPPPPGTCRPATRTAYSALNVFRLAPTWVIGTCSCSSWTATVISKTPQTVPSLDCFADSFSETAMWEPPPCPWMCSCSASSAAITSSGASSTWPVSDAARWGRRFRMRGPTRSRASASPSTPTPCTIARCSCGGTTQEIAPTRDGVLDAVTQRLDLPQKHAAEEYTLAEQFERNLPSVWGYVQGLTRLSQRTPWQDGRSPSTALPVAFSPRSTDLVSAVRAQRPHGSIPSISS